MMLEMSMIKNGREIVREMAKRVKALSMPARQYESNPQNRCRGQMWQLRPEEWLPSVTTAILIQDENWDSRSGSLEDVELP